MESKCNVKMFALIDARLSGMNWNELKESDCGVFFGGYCFNVNTNGKNKDVYFDWNNFVSHIQKSGYLLLEAKLDVLDDYDEESVRFYRDLTAEVLSNTREIVEFTIDYDAPRPGDYIRLAEVSFEDGEGNTYNVSQTVLDDFNYKAVEDYVKNGFHLGACDLEGFEVTEDDIQAIHTRVSSCPHLSIPAVTLSYFKEVREIMNYDLEIEE